MPKAKWTKHEKLPKFTEMLLYYKPSYPEKQCKNNTIGILRKLLTSETKISRIIKT